MGREVRRVPPGWVHPRDSSGQHMPLHDRTADEEWAEWYAGFVAWQAGERDRVVAEYGDADYPAAEPYRSFCGWHGQPPDPQYYRLAWGEPPTAYQVYETVTEGTPISPVFLTREELIDWLVNDGGRMGIGGSTHRMSREAADRFVGGSGSVSLVVEGGAVKSGLTLLEGE